MAYNAVGTPRFYISWGDWWQSLGATVPWYNTLNPVSTFNTANYTSDQYYSVFANAYPPVSAKGLNYLAVLNHNVTHTPEAPYGFQVQQRWASPDEDCATDCWIQEVAAGRPGGDINLNFFPVQYKGFSLATFGRNKVFGDLEGKPPSECAVRTGFYNEDNHPVADIFDIGCLVYGKYFDMPHSPDLNLTLSYETGTKTIQTRGGASLSNTMWRPPMWGNLGQWELNIPSDQYPDDYAIYNRQKSAHSSRRSWDLSFSYLDKTNVFPKYNSLNAIESITGHIPDPHQYALEESEDFYTQVWNRVGTNLPFIFQPDKDVAEFAICKFTKNISFQQTSPGLFSVKCRIRETW